jgi:hypothetical protein
MNIVEVKVKSYRNVINQVPSHEDVWSSGVIDPPFLISALNICEWSASRLGRFNTGVLIFSLQFCVDFLLFAAFPQNVMSV